MKIIDNSNKKYLHIYFIEITIANNKIKKYYVKYKMDKLLLYSVMLHIKKHLFVSVEFSTQSDITRITFMDYVRTIVVFEKTQKHIFRSIDTVLSHLKLVYDRHK